MIDLKSLAHPRYRITLDESDRDSPRSERPWLWQVPCLHGHIGVWGENTLSAFCKARHTVKPRLLAIPGAKLVQDGEGECTITFPPERFEEVATILQARKRRIVVLTPEQIASRREILAGVHSRRLNSMSTGDRPDAGNDDGDPNGVDLPWDDDDANSVVLSNSADESQE